MPLERTHYLPTEQVYTALKKGQGRAYWHIGPSNHELYRDFLLELCVRTAAYDPFNEEDRAPWLFQLLKRTGALNSYRDEIVQALYSAENQQDKRQLLRLVGEFAKQDIDAFRAFCDNAIPLLAHMEQESLAAMLLELAERDGLVDVAEIIGKLLTTQPATEISAECWAAIYTDDIYTDMDREIFIATVLEWMAVCPIMDTDLLLEEEPEHAFAKTGPQPASRSVNELFEIAQSEIGSDPASYAIWAATEASKQDLLTVFERLLQETQPELQLRLLWVFQNKPMPRLDFKILYIALSEDSELQKAAIQALSNLQDPEVRRIAFRLIEIVPNALHYGTLSLFFENYESEDATYIEDAIATPEDVDLCQALCEQILTLCQKRTDEPELTKLLLWAYENTPSSATRFEIVRLLIELEAAPRSLLEEACHDCDSMTRQFATNALA